MSEDAYLGDAQFTVAVDGVQLAGTFTTTALHAFGTSQTFTFMGEWGVGPHAVTGEVPLRCVCWDAFLDRNLYVNGISYDGVVNGQTAVLLSFGSQELQRDRHHGDPSATILPPSFTIGSGADILAPICRRTDILGDAGFTVAVDGVEFARHVHYVGVACPEQPALHDHGRLGLGPHSVSVKFFNDGAWRSARHGP